MLVALNRGIPNALRRAVSLEPALLSAAWRRLLTLHLPLAVGAAVLVAVGAPWAAILFGDPLLTGALRVIAADVALRAGVVEPGWLLLNGAGRHRLQATLLPTSAILSATCFRRVAGLVPSEPAAVAKILRTVLGGACLLTFLAIIAIPLCGGPLLRFVFGDAFAGATRLLLLIWLGMTGTALTWFFCEMLAAAQALTVRLWAAIWSGVGSAVATTVTLQLGGLPGAAAGLLVGSILGVVLIGAALHRIVSGLWPTMPFMNRISPSRENHRGAEEEP